MGKQMKVIVIGLPLFAKRLAKSLSSFDKSNSYIWLNTYYAKIDKLKARFLIPRVDCIISINGSIETSKVFDLALNKKKPLIMNWVGTDVLTAISAFRSGKYRKDYIDNAIHFCEVNWIQDELKEIGINADIVNFASFDKKFQIENPTSEKFTVLTYIPNQRSDFYGPNLFLNVARFFPEIDFLIAGTTAEEYQPLPENVKALGWVEDMDSLYAVVHVCVRIPEHDGLSTFILEALARGKDVIYKYPFDYCMQAENEMEFKSVLQSRYLLFTKGLWNSNHSGAEFIANEFNSNQILSELKKRLIEITKRD
jgi:glycosyltransferase involved in cell wall biosynthesis